MAIVTFYFIDGKEDYLGFEGGVSELKSISNKIRDVLNKADDNDIVTLHSFQGHTGKSIGVHKKQLLYYTVE